MNLLYIVTTVVTNASANQKCFDAQAQFVNFTALFGIKIVTN